MNKTACQHLSFTFYLIFVSLPLLCLYTKFLPPIETLYSAAYFVSIAGYYSGILFLANVILYPTRLRSYSSWIAPTIAWLWLIYLTIDIVTYNLYRFHVNILLIEMMFMDSEGVGVPGFLLAAATFAASALAALVYVINRLSRRTPQKLLTSMLYLRVILIPAAVANSAIHICATYGGHNEVTAMDPLFPLYFPVTSKYLGQKAADIFPSVFSPDSAEQTNSDSHNDRTVNYPIAPLSFEKPLYQPSILILVIESWQAETLRPDVMPNVCQFMKGATHFEKHLSGGSTTVPGLFSLLFGLHSSYYERFRSESRSHPSLLTESLHESGYRSSVFTSGNLDRFSLRSLFFSKVKDSNYHAVTDDRLLLEHYLTDLKKVDAQDKPRFDFLFFTSSHSPYRYPSDSAKFAPLPALEGGFAISNHTDPSPYKNDYLNSLHYTDKLLKQIFDELRAQQRLDHTTIIITGDHAEEFNENKLGYWGHGSNFTRWQTHTPLIFKMPGQSKSSSETRMTLHQDVSPTIMQSILGCKNPLNDYTNGVNLFELPEKRCSVLASYFAKAYLIDDHIVENLSGKTYSWFDMNSPSQKIDLRQIKLVMQEERMFLD